MSVELTSSHCGMKALQITSKHLLALNVLFFFFSSEHCTTENGGNISTSTTVNWSARKALVILWSAGKTTIILMKNQERLQGDWKMKGTSLFLKTLIQWRNPPLLPPQKIKKKLSLVSWVLLTSAEWKQEYHLLNSPEWFCWLTEKL